MPALSYATKSQQPSPAKMDIGISRHYAITFIHLLTLRALKRAFWHASWGLVLVLGISVRVEARLKNFGYVRAQDAAPSLLHHHHAAPAPAECVPVPEPRYRDSQHEQRHC